MISVPASGYRPAARACSKKRGSTCRSKKFDVPITSSPSSRACASSESSVTSDEAFGGTWTWVLALSGRVVMGAPLRS
ncbi:hypothetical protein G7085_11530 [Tessaracoccus sp. HDW20]|uniref:hypothetical protein n=1 Tax=Tessaracoccus coleopterorum TaxID=2714950 RepID=UPI0018D36A19|nr:hypothetical protein [Tessaracoccus coleopterorum]NHB85024.1 hypothetical protein [Tessaracoccus coleopterorum]